MERSVSLRTRQLVNSIATSSGIRVSSWFSHFPALNKVGFLRRFQFRIMAVAGRFVLQSDEEMNEFSQSLKNENTGYFVFSMKPTRIVVKLDYLKTQ